MKRKKKDESKANCRYSTIKMGLRKLLRPKFKEPFLNMVNIMCYAATRISVLASMLMLYHINKAVDDGGPMADEFFSLNGRTVVENCFKSIIHHTTLPWGFRNIVARAVARFIWPERDRLYNAFNSMIDMYETNMKTNIAMHSKSHIKKLFRIKQYEMNEMLRIQGADNEHLISDIDVKRAVTAVFYHRRFAVNHPIRTENVDWLIEEARMFGVPVWEKMCLYVKVNWFASLRWWIKIQREIDEFHMKTDYLCRLWEKHRKNPLNNPAPSRSKPPKIHNFNAVPGHNYHRKHIKIDKWQFYEMARTIGALKHEKGKRFINISRQSYTGDLETWWDKIFDMKKIKKHGKRQKTFDFQISTDGVAVSLMYTAKPKSEKIFQSPSRIRDIWKTFVYILGIDPGVRTWNATVRKHMPTGTEVSHKLVILIIELHCIAFIVVVFFSIRKISRSAENNTIGKHNLIYVTKEQSECQKVSLN